MPPVDKDVFGKELFKPLNRIKGKDLIIKHAENTKEDGLNGIRLIDLPLAMISGQSGGFARPDIGGVCGKFSYHIVRGGMPPVVIIRTRE